RRVRAFGWEPALAKNARGRFGYLSGTDPERLADLDAAIRDVENDAIWCLRGGYGTMRIADAVDFRPLRERPRPLIGFSDNTVLHLLANRLGVVTFHGPHPGAEDLTEFSLECLRMVVSSPQPPGLLPFPGENFPRPIEICGGVAEAPMVGGNLSLLG